MTKYQVTAREDCVTKTATPQTGSKLVEKKEVFITRTNVTETYHKQ